jgi:hypothetical protein
MTHKPSIAEFERRLLPMLLDAHEEQASFELPVPAALAAQVKKRQRFVAFLAAACVATLVLLALPVLTDSPSGGALAIDKRGEMLHLRVEDAAADPEAMNNELRAAGIYATVEVVPVSPSLVGYWVNIFEDEPEGGDADPRSLGLWEQLPTPVFKLPSDYTNPLTLTVGRAAQKGETWAMSLQADALDDVGPNGAMCHFNLAKVAPRTAHRALTEQGFEVQWSDEDLNSGRRLSSAPAEGVIVYAFLMGPDTIRISVAAAGSEVAEKAIDVNEKASC